MQLAIFRFLSYYLFGPLVSFVVGLFVVLSFLFERRYVANPGICHANRVSTCHELSIFCVWFVFLW